jgi:hypothetical protein
MALGITLVLFFLGWTFQPTLRAGRLILGKGQFQVLPLSLSLAGVEVTRGYAGWSQGTGHPRSTVPALDRNIEGGELNIDGIKFEHGIGTHAPSELVLKLDGRYRKFSCFVGLDRMAPKSPGVVYTLKADGREIFRSPKHYLSSEPLPLSADISGVRELTLGVETTELEDDASDVDWVQVKWEP